MLFRSPKPQTPNPKPQTPNPKPRIQYSRHFLFHMSKQASYSGIQVYKHISIHVVMHDTDRPAGIVSFRMIQVERTKRLRKCTHPDLAYGFVFAVKFDSRLDYELDKAYITFRKVSLLQLYTTLTRVSLHSIFEFSTRAGTAWSFCIICSTISIS